MKNNEKLNKQVRIFSAKKKCKNLQCDFFPLYGMAPHRHEFAQTGHWIGSTVLLPEDSWPKEFIVDPTSKGAQGIWHCPECLNKIDETRERMKSYEKKPRK